MSKRRKPQHRAPWPPPFAVQMIEDEDPGYYISIMMARQLGASPEAIRQLIRDDIAAWKKRRGIQ